MRLNYRIVIGSFAAIFLAAAVLCGCKKESVVVRTAKSSGGITAEIIAYRDSIVFGTYSADLLLRSTNGQIFQQTNLITSRDSVEDMVIEFLSLDFKSNTVHLGAKGVHYRGPIEFKFE